MVLNSLSTLIFDLDGTLCSYDTDLEEHLLNTFETDDTAELPITPSSYQEGFGVEFDKAIDGKIDRPDLEFRTRIFWLFLEDNEGYDEKEIIDFGKKFTELREDSLSLFPEVPGVFEELRDKYKLGLLTNGPSSLQRKKIEVLGIGDWFDSIVVSGEHHLAKPDPKIFEVALADLNIEEGEAIYVGNSLQYDVLGANNANLPVVWRKNGEEEEVEEATPDFVIEDLTELVNGKLASTISDFNKRSIKS